MLRPRVRVEGEEEAGGGEGRTGARWKGMEEVGEGGRSDNNQLTRLMLADSEAQGEGSGGGGREARRAKTHGRRCGGGKGTGGTGRRE